MTTTNTAKVIINNPSKAVDKAFSYLYDEKPEIGSHVLIPFGRGNKLIDGLVIGFGKEEESDKLKHINSVLETEFDQKDANLLCWIRDRYACTYFDALRLIMPPGSMSGKKRTYSSISDKLINFASVADGVSDLPQVIEMLRKKAPAACRVLEILSSAEDMAVTDLCDFAATSRSTVSSLEKKGLIRIFEKKIERNPFSDLCDEKSFPLSPTDEQKNAIDAINSSVDKNAADTFLIRGITGSGKTEVYLQAVQHVLDKGKNAIILVPEISLTPQMARRFTSRFGKQTAIYHSRLSAGERFDAWNRIKSGGARVIVGARSGIFTPVKNLGIIVIDEEHETSYKSDMTPKYDAREVAERKCKENGAVLVLASATPDVCTAKRAVDGDIKLLQIKNRYNNVELPFVNVIDLRQELLRGNRSFLSYHLQDEIEQNLKNKEQTILFLNRRGFSTFVSCRKCGYVAMCPECDIALTYHKYSETLKCHYCGYQIDNYKKCPKCDSPYIKYFGMGTQKVEDELKKLFPGASVIRMDNDTTREKFSHQKILDKFKNENIDILVGTQMITKGLDFPNVSLVGVLAADMMLYHDDYKATERTFQLITQVCGRAGRGEKRGRAVIQTYCPDHWVIDCAKKQDYRNFYKKEMLIRKKLLYPPYSDIISVFASGENPNNVKNVIKEITGKLYEKIKFSGNLYNIMGPAPAPIVKINNCFRWRTLIKCKADEGVRKNLKECLQCKNDDVTVTLDINPNNML